MENGEVEPVSQELRAPLLQCAKSQVLPDCPAQELHKNSQKAHSVQGNRGRLALDEQGAAMVNR